MDVAKELEAAGWERASATADPEGKHLTYRKPDTRRYFAPTSVIMPNSPIGQKNPGILTAPLHYILVDNRVITHTAATPELLLTKIKLLGLL